MCMSVCVCVHACMHVCEAQAGESYASPGYDTSVVTVNLPQQIQARIYG